MSNPPPVDIETIRQLAADGLTQAEIARELGVTRSCVSRQCTRHDIETRFNRQAAGRKSKRRVYQAHHDAGGTAEEFAEKHKITVESAIRVARTYGIIFRREGKKKVRLSVSAAAIRKWENRSANL
jgi:IS30 family transposase